MPSENAELDSYINDLADIKEEPDPNAVVNNEGDDNDEPDAGDDTGSDQQQQPNKSDDGGNKQDQSADPNTRGQEQKVDGKKGQQPGKGKKDTKTDGLRPLGDGSFANAKGDIVDAQGNLIASNGFAARMYNSNRRMKTQLEERSQQLNELASQVGELKSLSQSIRNYNLDNNEVAQALDIAGRMKRGDALGAAKEVLAIIVAQGYNVTDLLGSEVGDSIETRSIRHMIDERLAPLTRQEQDRVRQTEAEARGRQNYERFVADNEYADVHSNDIVQVMKRENVNPQTAYNRLYKFAAVNGLDFSQPLGPQVTERLEAQQKRNGNAGGGQQQTQQPQQRQQKPMPNGAATRTNGAFPTTPMASADDDWGSIIHEVQRTIGH